MLRIVTPPASEPVTLAEAKAQLRITDTSTDTVITGLIPAATRFCQSLVQRVFVAQTLEWVLPCWRPVIEIPVAPVKAADITSINYIDWNSLSPVVLNPSTYVVQTRGDSVRIIPKFGTTWPLVFYSAAEPIVIRFDAGYDDPADLPANVKVAILLQLRHLYSMGEKNLNLTKDTVFGVGEKQYQVPANLMSLIPDVVKNLMLDQVW